MVLRLVRIIETQVENQDAFLSEYALENNLPENKDYKAIVLQVLTSTRPENLKTGKRYRVNLELISKSKK